MGGWSGGRVVGSCGRDRDRQPVRLPRQVTAACSADPPIRLSCIPRLLRNSD